MSPTTDFSQYLKTDDNNRRGGGVDAFAEHSPADQKTVLKGLVDQAQSLVWSPETKDQLATRDNVSHYTAEIGKTASLFAKGWVGRVGTAALFALDGAKKEDEFPTQALDALLGVTRGTAMRGLFGASERLAMDAPMKGITLGIGSRFIDNMTDRRNYAGANTNPLQSALATSLNKTFDGGSLLCDAAIFGSSELLMRGVLKPGDNAVGKILKTSISGGVFGASSGVVGEFQQQTLSGAPYDLGKILKSGASHAAVGFAGAGLAGAYNLRFPGENASRSRIEERERSVILGATETGLPIVRATGFDHLTLTPRYPANLEALRGLLQQPVVETATIKGQLPARHQEVVKGELEAFQAKLPDVVVDLNVYRPKGLPEIAIPKTYDMELNPVRKLRQTVEEARRAADPEAGARLRAAEAQLADHRLGKALLPEELLTAVAQMPELASTKRITLLPEGNPEDPFYAHKHNMPGFRSEADVSRSGQMTLYRPERSILDFTPVSPLRNTVIHEWSHLLRWQAGVAGQSLYDRTTLLEPDKTGTPYSKTSHSEDMARNVTQLLHGDPQTMLTTARVNPLRSAVVARLVEQRLGETPPEGRSKYHDVYLQRTAAIKAVADPLAQQALLDGIAGNRAMPDGVAARLLIDMGWGEQLGRLGPVASLDLARTAVTDRTMQHLAGKTIGKLDLSSAEALTAASAGTIASLQGLTEFRAPHTNFGPELLPALAAHPQLQFVDLRLTQIPRQQIKQWAAERPQIKVTH